MNKHLYRISSFILVLIILLSSFPVPGTAEEKPKTILDEADLGEESEIDQTTVDEEMKAKAGLGILEIESLREESSKHFQLGDGGYQAIAYTMAVHRKDAEGKWQDIDNRLYIDQNDTARYSTNDRRFSFSEMASSETLYSINDGTYRVSIGLMFVASNPSTAIIDNHPDRLEIAQDLEGEEKLQALINVDTTTTVKYSNVLGSTDLEYIITGNDVKENIVLEEPIALDNLSFTMSLDGLLPELAEDGSIRLVNESADEIYCITAPYMYDSAGEESNAASYSLETINGAYSIHLDIDEKWINDSSRVYPIIIDPTITDTQNVSSDTYISSGNPATNYGSNSNMLINSGTIAYLKATMPTLPTYTRITQAQLKAKFYSNSTTGSMEIELYRCVRSWNESTLSWNIAYQWTNRGLASARSSSATATATSGMSSSNPSEITFGISNLVRKWYAGTSNLGVGLKYGSGSLSSVRICSREASSSNRPYFSITYTPITTLALKNGTYFLKNKKTERYIYVSDESLEEGAYARLWDFHGNDTQKWSIKYTHYANYYTISPVESASMFLRIKDDSSETEAMAVLSTGTNSNGTRTMTDGMLWSITETSSGAYKIKAIVGEPNDRVIAADSDTQLNNGGFVEQRNYTNNTEYIDEWYAYRISGTKNMFVGINSDGHNHTAPYDALFGYLFENGDNNFNFIKTDYLSSSSCLTQMESAKIFVCRCHGNYNSDSTYISLYDTGTASLLYSTQIYNSSPLVDFGGMDLAVFAACYTAKNYSNGKNLADAAVNAGAEYAIGFKEGIICNDANEWVEVFFRYYMQGSSVSYSCQKASEQASSIGNHYYIAH